MNVFLILGSVKEIRFALLIWILATIVTLIWEFVLLSILFSYDTTVGKSILSETFELKSYETITEFVLILAILHLLNFILLSYFIIVVFSYYQVHHPFSLYFL